MAQVSGIQVRFSGDTAPLERSVGKANAAIAGFAKSAAAGLAGALSVGAFVAAGKAALNYADNIGKMAQKIGMTTEELSKLNYAAKLSDVSLGELQMGLQQLSKNMEAGADGLAALGISVTDASGNLRNTNDVMLQVAEAFAGMEDGAGKTAIAMNIFGRAGANLIPLLNSGRKGLADMAGEAQNLGVVISQDAAKSAEQFNDNLTRLHSVMDGLAQSVIAPLLPTLTDLSETLVDLIKNSKSTSKTVDAMEWVLRNIAQTAATTYKEFYGLSQIWFVLMENLANPTNLQGATDRWKTAFANIRMQAEETEKTIQRLSGAFSASPDDLNSMLGSIDEFEQGPSKTKAPRLPGTDDSKKDKRREADGFYHGEDPFFVERLQMIRDNFATEREVLAEEFAMNQEVLKAALDNQLLTEQGYYDLSQKLAQSHQAALNAIQAQGLMSNLAAASDFFGSMEGIAQQGGKRMLKVAKAFGAAQALVATFQAAAQAMADWSSFTPYQKLAAYAAIVSQGMAAVKSIKGVSENGGGGSGSGARGGSAAAAAASSAGAGGGPTTTFQFTLMNDPMGFGEKFARQFIDQLNSTQRNGGQIRGVIA